MAPLVEASVPAVEVVEVMKQTKDVIPAADVVEEAPECVEEGDNNAASESEAQAEDVVAAVATEALVESGRRKRVQFEDADVVEFEPTMWTATVASDGVPLGMSTNVRRRTRRRLDSYESEREMTRVDRQVYMEFGYLEPEERLDILEYNGNALSELTLVEHDNLRINRERWESNEYDLMYQYGLGEVPVMDLSDDDEMEAAPFHVDDPMLSMDDSDDGEYFFNSRNLLVDADVRFAMEMDAYDVNPRAYEDLNVDYASDCILGDDEDSDESNELPYGEDSFDAPLGCADEDPVASTIEMSSSPSDVADGSDCLLSGCAKQVSVVSPPSVAADANVAVAV